ncbi:hypothetical protein ACFQ5N_03725 [Lutibacter holmesii]|uniref:Uncharacterized protein n=1 Tax=Lutibacter holmesii TaxID=1137985 RepID=A0ABW3WLC5_9FLAO
MINMINPAINFLIKLTVFLVLIFGIHIAILQYLQVPIFSNLIVQSYIVNVILAIVIYGLLYFFRKKYLDLLGFIFMGGSFLKFGVYFIFFQPTFKANGTVSKLEAISFLIPYLACLLVEIYYLIKLLNKD